MSTNLTWHQAAVSKDDRARQKRQKPCVIWFTGLSGAGKSTLANALERALFERGHHCYLLDGDNVRHGLNRDLGFSDADRVENIRRIAEVAKLLVDAGLIAMTAFISPFRADRQLARDLLPADEFIEVHVATSLAVCEQRDPKGLYRKARAGQIPNFTGIDSAYEAPVSPELVVDTGAEDLDGCVQNLLAYLEQRGIF
ncbi:MAG: adenylyl-sulfate kinase [Gammaproteobacteria bacterium]|nr:adenylyl-sulfate kinase [Gammaproteobacteria bacterium]MBK8133799.1 adenylyl-sulfate kinase [Gammaproteobacteria bacterium]MBK9426614.1 adenylyl-sulfate kinase [Gammaproteobacteria bacterium]